MMNSEPGPPMMLGNAAAAHVRLIVWCVDCHHQVEPDPGEMAARYVRNAEHRELYLSGLRLAMGEAP